MQSLALCTAVFTLLTATLRVTGATCGYGFFRTSNRCKACPPGTYQSGVNRWACVKCPSNTYSFASAAQRSVLCRPCPPNSLSPFGASSCTRCPLGHVRDLRGIKCVRCPAGSHLSWTWSGCLKCDFKTYSSRANLKFCIPCPVYGKPNAAKTGCVPALCPYGTRMLYENGKCVRCHFYTLSTGKQSSCGYCPDRFYAPANSNDCALCRPGTYIDTYKHKSAVKRGSPKCKPCPSGSTTKGAGKPLCTSRSKRPACPTGTFLDKDGDCNACLRDEFRNTRLNTCVHCPVNQYSFGGLDTSCTPCLPGQVLKDKYTIPRCQCRAGYVVDRSKRKCVPCPAGTFQVEGKHRCDPCPPYQFTDKAGMTSCKSCPSGTSSALVGGRACKKVVRCVPGYVALDVRDGCVSAKSGCPKGMTLRAYGTKRHLVCTSKAGSVWCPAGTIFNKRDRCISCKPGERVESNGKARKCQRCRGGFTTVEGTESRCERCPPGFFVRGNDCICNGGSYISEAGECVPCAKGSYRSLFSDCYGDSYYYP